MSPGGIQSLKLTGGFSTALHGEELHMRAVRDHRGPLLRSRCKAATARRSGFGSPSSCVPLPSAIHQLSGYTLLASGYLPGNDTRSSEKPNPGCREGSPATPIFPFGVCTRVRALSWEFPRTSKLRCRPFEVCSVEQLPSTVIGRMDSSQPWQYI